MTGLIEKIKSRSSSIKERRNTFLSKLVELNDALAESLNGIDVWARSAKKSLEMIGPDDWIYGYLSFSEGRIEVVYRSTEDDFHDAMSQVPEEYESYQSKSINSCSIAWLEKLSSENNINKLLSNIEKSLASIENNTIGSIESLNKALDTQSEEISDETIEALREASSDELIRHWLKARSSIQSDPADSITRSSSYLESVCRLILTETGEPLPNKKDMTNLIGSAVKALDLSDDSEANNDLKQLFGGIKSIFQSVGSMRTHFGTAHGVAPGDYVPKEHYARLISDASATASTYLLRRLKQKLNKSMQQTAHAAAD
ncbi:MAG: abortive infection family protein [Pseudomonadota bacterium]|uniref:abortive infection family protein n=1 Tax=Gallaecimonas pentaromativorans TaxID=584787 RepID=UPI0012EE6C9D|nr:abortive infection family protein [Gallaecimonas pentaromativorans]MED5523690.1 abortive infection family protein [Pseudomonadota bacterium]